MASGSTATMATPTTSGMARASRLNIKNRYLLEKQSYIISSSQQGFHKNISFRDRFSWMDAFPGS
jgi:hypothetical protein